MAKNTFPIEDPRKLLRRIQEGGDALGLERDPELLVHLAKAARRRFLEERTPEAFSHWRDVVSECRKESVEGDPGYRVWLRHSWLELGESAAMFGLEQMLHAEESDAELMRTAPEDERDQIRDQLRFLVEQIALKVDR